MSAVIGLMWWLLLLLVLAAVAPGAAAAAPGDRDPTFGDRGEVVTAFSRADVFTIDAQGRFLIGGPGLETNFDPPGYLARYDAHGRLDPSFHGDGVMRILPSHDWGVRLTDVAVLPNGRLLVAGLTFVGPDDVAAIVVLRLEANGRVDTSFAGGNLVISRNADDAFGRAQLLVRDDGRLSIAAPACGDGGCGLALFHYTADGAPRGRDFDREAVYELEEARVSLARDGTFRVTGRTADPSDPQLALVSVDADGRFVGRTVTDLPVSRFWVPTFGLRANDALLAVGDAAGYPDVRRFLANGDPDPAWSRTLVTPEGTLAADAVALTAQPDGRAVVVGTVTVPIEGPLPVGTDPFLVMVGPNGGLDPTFGNGGIVVRGEPAIGSAVSGVGVQPDGRIVVAASDGPRIVLVRYAGSTRACGDADGDATLTVTDGIRVLRAAAELPSSCRSAFCDTDASGSIGVTDGVRVLRAAAALPVGLECAPSH